MPFMMFSHVCILIKTATSLMVSDPWLQAAFKILERHEHGLYPPSFRYAKRLFKAYGRRWRELFIYDKALWHLKICRRPIYLVEEAILRGDF
jgi:hypothetical protein